MTAATPNRTAVISPVVAVGLVILSMLSLISYFALSAYAPDFRDESDGDAHALSKSAIGFAGLRVLLDASGVPNAIDRGSPSRSPVISGLVVVTPPANPGDIKSLVAARAASRTVLIILPKWTPMSDPAAYGKVLQAGITDSDDVERVLRPFSEKTKIKRNANSAAQNLVVVTKDFVGIPHELAPVDSLQTLSGPDWIPIVASRDGGAILAKLRDKRIYVLAEPDLMNTHGLRDLPTAAFSLAIIQRLREGSSPVTFDVTLNGFGRGPSLLRAAFAPPFLGATLCAILAAALVGFHAVTRFGSPPTESPVYLRGKLALINNAADLIRLLRREPHMARRYSLTMRNSMARALGLRRQIELGAGDPLLDTLPPIERASYGALFAEAGRVKSRSDLVVLAQKLYEWREGTFHAR